MRQIRAIKRREPGLGIDLLTVHLDGRVWVASRGPRPRLVERLGQVAAPERWHFHDLTAPTIYGYGTPAEIDPSVQLKRIKGCGMRRALRDPRSRLGASPYLQ